MRIGIDARLWSETGVGRYIRNLVYNLSEIDKKNEYVLFMRSEDRQQLTIDNSQLTKNKRWKIVPVDIRWHTVEEQLKFPKILEKENLDLMHFPYFSVPVNYKKPYVVTIHDLILNHFPTGKASTLPYPLYQLKRFGYKYVLNKAVKNAKKIIVPLNAIKDDLVKTMKVSGDRIEVTYEGVDSSLRVERSNPKDLPAGEAGIAASPAAPRNDKGLGKYFLYVGNAYPHKNIDRMIKAFSLLRKDHNEDTQLLLVGKDDYFYKKLSEKITNEKIEGIVIRNNVSDEELSQLYQNAIALVAPSLMEGFGLPVLEAMATKCLVLASDIPSFKEVAQDCSIYFDSKSVDDMNTKLNFAISLKDAEKMKYLEKGIDRTKMFSWKKMAQETLKAYEDSSSV